MLFEEIEATVKKAINKLTEIKKIPISLREVVSDLTNTKVKLYDYGNGDVFVVEVEEAAFTDPPRARDPNESITLPQDVVVMLRVAKVIYNEYVARQSLVSTPSATTGAPIFTGNTLSVNNATSSTLTVQNLNVDGRSINVTVTKVDELEEKLKDLKAERDKLDQELQDTKAALQSTTSIVDVLLQKCQEKGIL